MGEHAITHLARTALAIETHVRIQVLLIVLDALVGRDTGELVVKVVS